MITRLFNPLINSPLYCFAKNTNNKPCTYRYHIFDERFVRGHFRPLQHTDRRSHPGDQQEFGSSGHFVASLDADVSKCAFIVAELLLELVEIFAFGRCHDCWSFEFKHSPEIDGIGNFGV